MAVPEKQVAGAIVGADDGLGVALLTTVGWGDVSGAVGGAVGVRVGAGEGGSVVGAGVGFGVVAVGAGVGFVQVMLTVEGNPEMDLVSNPVANTVSVAVMV